jgi:hypothetical membrane protein
LALWLGAFVPVLYFGTQLVAAQFYPGYSFVAQSASELGSPHSDHPWILNSGAIATGVATLIAATAFPAALRRFHTPKALIWITVLAMISMGAAAIWAGTFSLPDPRHNPRAIGIGAFLLPVLFAADFFRAHGEKALKTYLFSNLALFVLMIPVMANVPELGLEPYRGALQRVAAAILYVPVGVIAFRARAAA